jgi:hypothetical protein
MLTRPDGLSARIPGPGDEVPWRPLGPAARDIIDDRLIRGLHVEAVRRSGLRPGHEPEVAFQTSTLQGEGER